MKISFGELLEHNGYKLGSKKNIRKKTFREVLADTPREVVEQLIRSHNNFSRVINSITGNQSSSSETIDVLIQALEHWGIDYSHIQREKKSRRRDSVDSGMLPEEILDRFFGEEPQEKLSWVTLRRLIERHNLLPQQCSECGISAKWNGKKLTMQIDHINGNRDDNRIENLRRLCPNCHTQTDTYCSKNRYTAHISALIDAKKV